MKTMLAFIIAAACLASAAWADTPIYKWVDAQGKVHYSTEPHSDQAQQLSIVNKGTGTAPAAATSAAPAAGSSADKALTQPSATDSPACKSTKETLAKYLGADYLYTLGDKGEKQKMPKEQQDKTIADARDAVTKACGAGGTP